MVFLRLRVSDLKLSIFRTTSDVNHPRQLTPWSLDSDLPFASPARSGPTKDLVVFETYGEGAPDPFRAGGGHRPGDLSLAQRLHPRHPSAHACHGRSQSSVYTEAFNPSWSPSGRSIVYVSFRWVQGAPKASGDIWTMRFNGEHKQRLSQSNYFNYRPVWGPPRT